MTSTLVFKRYCILISISQRLIFAAALRFSSNNRFLFCHRPSFPSSWSKALSFISPVTEQESAQHTIMSKRTLQSDSFIETSNSSKLSKSLNEVIYQPQSFHPSRARYVTVNQNLNTNGDCVVLWMSRDQRVEDNYALICAQEIAIMNDVPVRVVFNLVPKFLQATLRQYGFMIKGLQEVETSLRLLGIPMHLTRGDPAETIPALAKSLNAMAVVADFSPLRVGRGWVQAVGNSLDEVSNTSELIGNKIPLIQVDAHNIVPCWIASDKLEYSARTIRSKIQSKIPQYLVSFPKIRENPPGYLNGIDAIDWDAALASLEIDRTITEVGWLQPGPSGGKIMLQTFAESRFKNYADKRNDPNEDVLSNLSPYFHFGQISAQHAVMFLKSLKTCPTSTDAFVEETVVRRELADNFCYYNPRYDSLEGCSDWAKETIRLHAEDKRDVVYTRDEFENAMTHDDLWNAAQIQMTSEGKMNGFLRMYWAKKILEWTNSPEEALAYSIYLNDRYELDGRDPNGYVGCMWSIGGIHDQGWKEREVFGKIRFMNYKGCQRKFDVRKFVSRYPPAAENAAIASQAKNIKNV